MNQLRGFICLLASLILFSSCWEEEGQLLAQVGEDKLYLSEVLLQMPLRCVGADSAHFVQKKVNAWVSERLLYLQGLRNVQNLDVLEKQAAQYRRDLIALTYQRERLANYAEEVSDEECMAFYEKYKGQMRLQSPIVQGFFIQIPSNSTKVQQLKTWLKEIQGGMTDHMEELEQFCQQRAVYYDSFMDQWSDIHRLTDHLAITVVDPAQFLRCQVYQIKDAENINLFLISDFRLKGEIKPFEYCREEVHELLVEHKQDKFRYKLEQEIRDEALRTGLLKLN